MKVEIIAIGDELLIGQTVDTNSAWIGEQLYAKNFEMIHASKIRDDKEAILEALETAESRAEIILITGGLGPTKDDITKTTLCEYFVTELVHNEEALENIKKLFEKRGRDLLQSNIDQASLPKASTFIPNPHGTASGMWFEKNEKIYVSMPGVPYEMKPMMENHVLPKLLEKFQPKQLYVRTILTEGIVESILADKIKDWEDDIRSKQIKLAYLPSPGMIRLRISAPSQKMLDEAVEELKKVIPENVFGEGKESLEELIGNALREKKQTVSTAESCTGGYIAHLITSISGSSDYFKGSIISYSNEMKQSYLDVKKQDLEQHGAVSQEVVEQMALGAKEKLKTDFAVATSGIAGPNGGTEEKPVGTVWIAVAHPKGVISKRFLFGDNRERNIRKAALSALSMLRKQILD